MDNSGHPVGANGIETGLLNILNGGTNNRSYEQFTDAQVQAAQALMIGAGFQYLENSDARLRTWQIGNDNKTIDNSAISTRVRRYSRGAVFLNEWSGYPIRPDPVRRNRDRNLLVH